MRIARVFPRRTKATPTDALAFTDALPARRRAEQQARALVLRLRGGARPGNAGGRGPGDAGDESGDGRPAEFDHVSLPGAGAIWYNRIGSECSFR